MEKTIVDLEDYNHEETGERVHMDFNYECPLCGCRSVCESHGTMAVENWDDEGTVIHYRKWEEFTVTCEDCHGKFIAEAGDDYAEPEYKPKTYRKGW